MKNEPLIRIIHFAFFLAVCFFTPGLMEAQLSWSQPVLIDTSSERFSSGGQMALNDSGHIFVAYSHSNSTDIFIDRSTDDGITWEQFAYSGIGESRFPQDIVVDHRGDVWLLWLSSL